MKIKKGDLINELSLPAIDGSVFDLQFVQGQKLMISFYRYSSCPFCHLRINETINNKENFGDNFQTVAIFNCSLDSLKKEVSNLIIILVGSMEEKSTILISISNDISATYDARNLLDSLSKIIGAKGGGKPDFAQAGGPASNKLDEILISAEKILTEI